MPCSEGGGWCERWWCGKLPPILAGDIVRECAERVGWAFSPTAQSGRAGRGCFEEVEVNVRWDDEDVVDDDYGAISITIQQVFRGNLQLQMMLHPQVSCNPHCRTIAYGYSIVDRQSHRY